jgi:uncharacterized phage protein gp47/JayE
MADFGVTRLSATASTGIITFSRYTTTQPALIPAGAIVKTADGLVSFAVATDASLSTWQPSSSGYVLPSGVSSADVPAGCLSAGAVGNVLPGTITMIASSLPGIDQVVNANAFTNGMTAESDQALRSRFQGYLASLSRATMASVQQAITNVQQGLLFTVAENTATNGATSPGSFLIVLDDGSGYPPSTLLSSVATAVELVRPIGTTFSVTAPAVLLVDVSLTIFVPATSTTTNLTSLVQTSIVQYLDSLPIQRVASVTRVAQSAYAASTLIYNISSVNLNGGTVDVVPPARTVIKAGQITVQIHAG